VNISKIFFSLIVVAMLFSTSFVIGEDTTRKEDVLAKHKKNLVIAGYGALAAYSAKKVAECFSLAIDWIIVHHRRRDFFDEHNVARGLFVGAKFFNIARLSLYGFLMCFSVKNMMQELRDKGQGNKKQELKHNLSTEK